MNFEKKIDNKESWLSHQDCYQNYRTVESVCVTPGKFSHRPLVSIMIPTYKRVEFLREAIQSALNQSSKITYEVVVVDNDQDHESSAKVDKLIEEFSSPILRLYRNTKNIGMFGNWNRCIELAQGEWVSILNDDDLLKVNWLESMSPYLKGESMYASSIEFFGTTVFANRKRSLLGKIQEFVENLLLRRGIFYRIVPSDMILGNPVWASLGVLFNRRAAIKLGGYNEQFWPISDYVFNVRYALAYDAYVLNLKLASYRFSVNESLQPTTVVGFITKNHKFRSDLILRFSKSKLHSEAMIRLNSLHTQINAISYQRILHNQNDFLAILRELDIRNSIFLPLRFCLSLIRIAFVLMSPQRNAHIGRVSND